MLNQQVHKVSMLSCLLLVSTSLLWGAAAHAEAQEVGSVVLAKGSVSAKSIEGDISFLGKGMPLYEGDVLNTGGKAFAVLKLADGSRMTLRPNTVFAIEKFNIKPSQETALLKLFRGGLRALTGFISKKRPEDGYRISTSVATIGIRGTEFDARICAEDCAAEAGSGPVTGLTTSPVVARVAWVRGSLAADETGQRHARKLVKGGPVYAGDTLQSGKGDIAVLVFRDDTRMTLRPNTRFQIQQYDFERNDSDNAVFRLFRGGLRALTGLVGKRQPKSFRVNTAVATIGIRGTGFDLSCEGDCDQPQASAGNQAQASAGQCQAAGKASGVSQADGLFIHTWQGSTEVQAAACTLVVNEGETAFLGAAGSRPQYADRQDFLDNPDAPRPDGIEVDMQGLFGTEGIDSADPGLYVSVYDGHVVVENDSGNVIDLGQGEAVQVGGANQPPVRLAGQPIFQVNDRFPRPEEIDAGMEKVLDLLFEDLEGDNAQCEIN